MASVWQVCIILSVWVLFLTAGAQTCRPCTAADGAECTHPGNADQEWCNVNCPNGVNDAGCPTSHCFCGSSATRFCRPCVEFDPGCVFPGNAVQAWCDSHCPGQVNTAVCLPSYCFCGEVVVPVTPTSPPAPRGGQGVDDVSESSFITAPSEGSFVPSESSTAPTESSIGSSLSQSLFSESEVAQPSRLLTKVTPARVAGIQKIQRTFMTQAIDFMNFTATHTLPLHRVASVPMLIGASFTTLLVIIGVALKRMANSRARAAKKSKPVDVVSADQSPTNASCATNNNSPPSTRRRPHVSP